MKRRAWTKEEDDLVRALYLDVTAEELGARLNRNKSAIYERAAKLGLRKPESFRSAAGKKGAAYPEAVAHRFRKGHVPANKGEKMTEETYAKVARTMFKPGHNPVNHVEVGSERVNIYGYVEIKTAEPSVWKLKHRYVWQNAHGPIPKGSIIQFVNGDRQDVRLENLRLITRAEQLRTQNCMEARYPSDLVSAIRTIGTLKRQITLYNKKQQKQKEQEHEQ